MSLMSVDLDKLDKLIKLANDWPGNHKVWDAQKDIVDLAYDLATELRALRAENERLRDEVLKP
jgi:hypothetical protein